MDLLVCYTVHLFTHTKEEGVAMANFNRVILLGNLTRDVELKYTATGLAVTEIGLAVNERRKNQQTGEWTEEPVFVDITLWGRTAEIASEYLSKGSPVLIEGRLKYDTWEKDGQKRSKLRVVGETMQLLGSRSGTGGSGTGGSGTGGSGTGGSSPRGQTAPRYSDSDGHSAPSEQPAGAVAGAVAGGNRPADDIPF
jgi:single-strand DNA-binding protein